MEFDDEASNRVAQLCKKLGKLFSEKDITMLDEVISENKIAACNSMLLGQLLNKPNINFMAFQTAMRRAWKNESVIITPMENGMFSFPFNNVEEKSRVLEGGPWSLSRHLLMLQHCDPHSPLHCYEFKNTEFWICVIGQPVGWLYPEIVEALLSVASKVEEIKLDARGLANQSKVKVKIEIDLLDALVAGHIATYKCKKI